MRRAACVPILLLAIGCGGAVAGGERDGGPDGLLTPDATASADATANASSDAPADVEDDACFVLASDFDLSCAADSDCAMVTTGNYCGGSACLCAVSAIRATAMDAFQAAVAKTPVGSGRATAFGCPCTAPLGPCCRAGACTVECWSPSDTLAACADAGGSCLPPGATCTRDFSGGAVGPPDACAFPDEACCR
ncbi:MAG TPA: hypothetical protein VGM06_12240 [Polyangiaceae bacterium]|jgi:hypothetical protein